MGAFGSGAGGRGGWSHPPVTTVDIMRDPGRILTLQENLQQGVGKAHRQVVFSNYEYRNFRRDAGAASGVIFRPPFQEPFPQ